MQGLDKFRHLIIRLPGNESTYNRKKRAGRTAVIHAHTPAYQIQGLDAISSLVQLRDSGIAHELLHALFVDVAVAAETLHGHVGAFETHVGEMRLNHGCQQVE